MPELVEGTALMGLSSNIGIKTGWVGGFDRLK